MTSPEGTERPAAGGRGRALLPRLLLAAAAPALVLGALEGALRLAGYGVATALFIPDGPPGAYRTNPSFTAPFIPLSFGIHPLNLRIQRHKPPNAVRVFVVGESAAQGMPEPDFGFAAQLRAQLRAAYPARPVELVNLGITAINSHVVRRAVEQAAAFEPDLFVVYMGNNEVVGPYGPGCAYLSTSPPLAAIRASAWVRGTRTGQLLAALLGHFAPSGSKIREWKGMETFSDEAVPADDSRMEAVYRNFSENLRAILAAARASGARVVLSTVVANLDDCPPFVSRHRRDLSPDDAKAWTAAYDAGVVARDLDDREAARAGFAEAERIDPQFAEVHYRMALLARSDPASAEERREFQEALHWDALRFRPDPRINALIREAAKAGGVRLVDAARELGADPDSAQPPAGRSLLLDHVHFTWEGNVAMGRLLAAACGPELFGPAAARAPLDADGCAAAVGYTDYGRLAMLKTVVQLMLRPPFTNQMDFSQKQARFRREIQRTSQQTLRSPNASGASSRVEGALLLDHQNPALADRLAAMEIESGNPEYALRLIDEAEALEPVTVELDLQRAEALEQLKRFDEARDLLLQAVAMDRVYYAPGTALVELWTKTGRFDEGRAFFTRELARSPGNPYLRLEYANLLALGGDAEAEGEARRVWESDRASRPAMAALELLVRLYGRDGRKAAADALALEAAPFQPGAYFNNERLVAIYAARSDAARSAEALEALAASGPFDARQHFDLARRLAELGRPREMLDELARAREVAGVEGDEAELGLVEAQIGRYRRRFGADSPSR